MALPTSLDNLSAMMYAIDRLKKERCDNSDMTGIEFVSSEENRLYTCPPELENCLHGHCTITSKEECEKLSQLPFDPFTGNELELKKCITNKDCDKNFVCSISNKCIPERPYLEFRDGKCVYGNFVLNRWCNFPAQRRTESIPGVTDVPPFQYDKQTGRCDITKDYCDWMRVSYEVDQQGRPNCYRTPGQKIGEFFLGKTIFRGLEGGTKLAENFAEIDLYLSGTKLGFLSKDIKRKFPELINQNGEIKFTKEDLKDKNKKRIYFILAHTDWISPGFLKAVKKKL